MNQVIIYGKDNSWNWKFSDDLSVIPILGKGFNTKEEAIKDWERYTEENNIKSYLIEEE